MSNAALAKIHIAKKQLSLDDDTYRAILERVTGRATSKGMSAKQHAAVLAEFQRLGWQVKPTGKGRKWRKKSNKAYVRKIYAQWGDLKRRGLWRDRRRAALIKFVKDMTGLDNPEFLTAAQAAPVIEALKAMQERGGGTGHGD